MSIIQIASFGQDKEGVHTYRVNGSKDDLERIIKEASKMGWAFWEKPTIEKVFKYHSVLLRIYDPKELYRDI